MASDPVVILSYARTPMGSMQGSLAGASAPQLGASAVKAAVERAGVSADAVERIYMGNVLSAGLGQAPARQAAIFAGLGEHVEATTLNKMCGSGLQAVIYGGGGWIIKGVGDEVMFAAEDPAADLPGKLGDLEAMRELWTADEAEYHGEFVDFGTSWAWPKPPQGAIPTLVGAAGNEKNFKWIARSADGWITTPGEDDIAGSVALLRRLWADAGRSGEPQIVVLDFKPIPERLEEFRDLGVTTVLYGLPDDSVERATAYLAKLAGKVGLAPAAAR